MIKNAIDGPWSDDAEKNFRARCTVNMDTTRGIYHPNPLELVWSELNAGRALIAGSLGHAVLIAALEFDRGALGYFPKAVIARDPHPSNPNRKVFSQQEYYNTSFLATLRVY